MTTATTSMPKVPASVAEAFHPHRPGTVRYDTFPTPLGPFTVAVDEAGAVIASAFGDAAALPIRTRGTDLEEDETATQEARRQLEEYFAGTRRNFDLPLSTRGSEFQERFWRELAAIPFGTTTTYGAMATKLGNSARAVGRANATNPICLILPCHRVIGSNGSLTGYAYGVEIKRGLLEHERVAQSKAQ